jgi:ATP-dependent RNA helicase SUPV3L1/SUV3
MILGSEALAPMVRALLPKAEIIGRPRVSTLTYAGPTKLSRLPPRSAIVAFSPTRSMRWPRCSPDARRRGGGDGSAFAPHPQRQVAMYQAGEVDYLVATDAIGMGLNMDVTHVAFAGLAKFDGRRPPSPHPAEMAQIAGPRRTAPARRNLRIADAGGGAQQRIPARRNRIDRGASFRAARPPLLAGGGSGHEKRRLADPLARAASRQAGPSAAPEAIDLAVLKRLAEDPEVRSRALGEERVRRLWAACGLPDFRKTGPEHHARLVARIFLHLTEGEGGSPKAGMPNRSRASTMSRATSTRLRTGSLGVRTWAYIAHRADWLTDPANMAERTRAVEEKLSDALHERLTQRFVDRRTSVLMRDLGGKGKAEFPFWWTSRAK